MSRNLLMVTRVLCVLLTTWNVHQLVVEIVFREMVQDDQHGLLPMVMVLP